MCGIVGTTIQVDKAQFECARDVLASRGPDGKGLFVDEARNVMMGHRRLSIIGLGEQGTQPMTDASGRYTMVFNGEIYNYVELKEELAHSYTFHTDTDTEVLLASYTVWGKGCLEKFNGMFAFAIYDQETGELFCARDRLGIKPFYYYQTAEGIQFASEIKALLALGAPKKINEAMLYDYLAFGLYDHTDDTFFEDIQKLPAGHYMTVLGGDVNITRYWDLTKPPIDYRSYTYDGLKEHLRTLLEDAIRLRFRSDVPVGINVSSGLDSNSILFFAEKITGQSLHLFSMCVPDETYNEEPYIAKVLSDKQKEKWHRSYVNPELFMDLAEDMQRIQDEPFGGVPTISYGELNKSVSETDITVVLEGQGGDELFAGYKYYIAEYYRDLLEASDEESIQAWTQMIAKRDNCSVEEAREHMKQLAAIDMTTRSQDMTVQVAASVLTPEFTQKFTGRMPKTVQKFDSHLLNAQYRDIMYNKLPRVLRFNDHVTMAYGKELRVPLLDHRIVEFAFFLPAEYKISPEKQKRLLRDAMEDVVPESTREAPKVTFGAVQTPWMRTYMKDRVEQILSEKNIAAMDMFDTDSMKQTLTAFMRGEGDNSFFVWQWVNLIIWHKMFIKQ